MLWMSLKSNARDKKLETPKFPLSNCSHRGEKSALITAGIKDDDAETRNIEAEGRVM